MHCSEQVVRLQPPHISSRKEQHTHLLTSRTWTSVDFWARTNLTTLTFLERLNEAVHTPINKLPRLCFLIGVWTVSVNGNIGEY